MIRDHVNQFNESEKGSAIVPDVFRHFEHSNDGSYRDSEGKYARMTIFEHYEKN